MKIEILDGCKIGLRGPGKQLCPFCRPSEGLLSVEKNFHPKAFFPIFLDNARPLPPPSDDL
jgi:hypothetical protein